VFQYIFALYKLIITSKVINFEGD